MLSLADDFFRESSSVGRLMDLRDPEQLPADDAAGLLLNIILVGWQRQPFRQYQEEANAFPGGVDS